MRRDLPVTSKIGASAGLRLCPPAAVSTTPKAARNHFLDGLDRELFQSLQPAFEHVTLTRNTRVASGGAAIFRSILPLSCILEACPSLGCEGRPIGSEGAFGLLEALGGRRASEDVFVKFGGDAIGIKTSIIAALAQRSPIMAEAVVQHSQDVIGRLVRAASCAAQHRVVPRLCTALVTMQDQLGEDRLPVTQEQLAVALGVQRTTVTNAAAELQAQGLIQYRRGAIKILNRAGVMHRACGCYLSHADGKAELASWGRG